MNWVKLGTGLGLFGVVASTALQPQNIVFNPNEQYYVSNNWDTVSYKPKYKENEVTQSVNYKLEEPPKTFSLPNDFKSKGVLMSKGGYLDLPFEKDASITIDWETGLIKATQPLPIFSPFDGQVQDVFPAIKSGIFPDVNSIFTISDGVYLTVVSKDKFELPNVKERQYLKMQLSHLSKTYASETHSDANAFTDIKNNLKLFYTNFSKTNTPEVSKSALLGRMGKTGRIENKSLSDNTFYTKVEVFRSTDKNDWVRVNFQNLFKGGQ